MIRYLNCPVSNRCWRTLEHWGKFMFCYRIHPVLTRVMMIGWICSTALKHEDNLPSDLHPALPEHWQFRKHTHVLFPAGFLTMLDPWCKPRRCSSPKTLFASTEQLNSRQTAVKVSMSSVERCRTVMKQHCVVSAASCSISCSVQKSVRDDVNTWHRWSSASCAESPGISVETRRVLLQRQVAVKHCQMWNERTSAIKALYATSDAFRNFFCLNHIS